MKTTTTIGELICDLVDAYERRYDDHELATVKTALVVSKLLEARARREVPLARGARRAA